MQTIGDESLAIVDLASIATVMLVTTDDVTCGTVTYILADTTQASFITVESTGLITLMAISDTSLVGNYTVQVMAYLNEIDPDAVYKKLVPLTITISIEDVVEDAQIVYDIDNSLTKAPPMSTTQMASLYEVFFDR